MAVITEGKNSKNNLTGIYKGRVEDNVDPYMIGRVRVRIPTLHGISGYDNFIESNSLPWASYSSPSGGGYDHGSFIPPEIGDYVWILFEAGDVSKPVYIGGSYGIGGKSKTYGNKGNEFISPAGRPETPLECQVTNPNKKVIYKSPKGATIWIDEEDGHESLYIIDRAGQCITLESPSEGGQIEQRGRRRFDEIGYGIVPDYEASISLVDAAKQMIKLSNVKGEEPNIILHSPKTGCKIRMCGDGIYITGQVYVDRKIMYGQDPSNQEGEPNVWD